MISFYTAIRTPIKLQTKYAFNYDSSGCSNENEIKTEMESRVQSLQCVENATCQVFVDINGCGGGLDRRRRSTPDLEVIVTFTSTLSESNALDLEDFYASKIGINKKKKKTSVVFLQHFTANYMLDSQTLWNQ